MSISIWSPVVADNEIHPCFAAISFIVSRTTVFPIPRGPTIVHQTLASCRALVSCGISSPFASISEMTNASNSLIPVSAFSGEAAKFERDGNSLTVETNLRSGAVQQTRLVSSYFDGAAGARLLGLAMMSRNSRGLTTSGSSGKCRRFPVTRYAPTDFATS